MRSDPELPPPEAEQCAEQAWRHAPVGMAWVRPGDGQLQQANASMRLLLGPEPTLPRLAELLGGEDAWVWDTLDSGRNWSARLPLNGRPCEWTLQQPAAHGARGTPHGARGTAQAALLLCVWPLQQALADAAGVAATLGHELRTPLAGVISLTELVLSSELGERQRRLLEMADQSARQLLELVNHTLDIAKLDAGALQLAPRPFLLHECLRDALQPLLAQAHAKGVGLQARLQPGLPVRLRADDLRLRQVLANLVGNALKFTDSGQVRVDVQRDRISGATGNRLRLRFSVTDTGSGIAAEALGRLFQPFAQVDPGAPHAQAGSGLGLVISQRLVRMLGGDTIEVESRTGIGSCFRFAVDAVVES